MRVRKGTSLVLACSVVIGPRVEAQRSGPRVGIRGRGRSDEGLGLHVGIKWFDVIPTVRVG